MKPESTASKKEFFYNDLKRRILSLNLKPGSDLDETELSTEYEISRTPLRDVFRRLAGEGYLVIRDRRGAQVSPMNQKSLRDFFLVAPMIYSAVSRLAAQNAVPDQIHQLEGIQARFVAALKAGDVEKRAFYNNQFHTLIGEMADNIFLTPSLRRLLIDHARIAQTFYQPDNTEMRHNIQIAAQQHEQMIAAIRTRDERRAAELAIEHWELSRESIERFVTPASLDIPLDS